MASDAVGSVLPEKGGHHFFSTLQDILYISFIRKMEATMRCTARFRAIDLGSFFAMGICLSEFDVEMLQVIMSTYFRYLIGYINISFIRKMGAAIKCR